MNKQNYKKSFVWDHFNNHSSNSAKCRHCDVVVLRSSGTTTAMANHLSAKHEIFKPNGDDIVPVQESKKRKLITNYMKTESLEEILAKCAAKNGFSIAGITNCDAIKGYVNGKGFEMPQSEKTIWKLILCFYEKKYKEQKQNINKLLSEGVNFSLSLDEWSDNATQRYVLILLHSFKTSYNLGMKKIPPGSCTSEVLESLVKEKLEENSLDLRKNIFGVTYDGAAVMVKFCDLLQDNAQFCLNHCIHLAVVDVLYKYAEEYEGNV
jgi:hypothetical protein